MRASLTRRTLVAATALCTAVGLAGCGSDSGGGAAAPALDVSKWDSVLSSAKGQTVNWYMYGGDDRLNAYVTGYVAREAEKLGIKVNQVKINDTVDAVNKVLGEKQAGKKDDGSVDLIWINGENFATGKQAKIWYCGWPKAMPSAKYVAWDDQTINTDFGTPVDDCEAPWNRSMSVITYNSAKVQPSAFRSVDSLVAWAKANRGRFTYPAPPDFNGSMTVRRMFYSAAGGYQDLMGPFDQGKFDAAAPKAWSLLNDLEPSLWRGGKTYPQSIDQVQKLFGSGEIDAYFTYDAGGVASLVDKGQFPKTTRQAVFQDGMIGNTNYLSIPYNSPHKPAAVALANLLQSPEAQLEKAKPDVLGYYPAIQADKSPLAAQFKALPNPPSVLPFDEQVKNANPELQAAWLTAIEKGWKDNVLQK
jgi:putative spermidine/putrescine transport system substrate-binding protein